MFRTMLLLVALSLSSCINEVDGSSLSVPQARTSVEGQSSSSSGGLACYSSSQDLFSSSSSRASSSSYAISSSIALSSSVSIPMPRIKLIMDSSLVTDDGAVYASYALLVTDGIPRYIRGMRLDYLRSYYAWHADVTKSTLPSNTRFIGVSDVKIWATVPSFTDSVVLSIWAEDSLGRMDTAYAALNR